MKPQARKRFEQINFLVDEALKAMPKGSRTQQVVLLVLWRMASPSGGVRVSMTQIGKLLNIQPRQVASAIADLETWGMLKRLPQKDSYYYKGYAINYNLPSQPRDALQRTTTCATAPNNTR